jgi:hypothetical protein
MAAFELVDGVLEIPLRVDAQDDAVVDEGVSHRKPLTAADRAGEEKIVSADSKVANSALGPAVVPLRKR